MAADFRVANLDRIRNRTLPCSPAFESKARRTRVAMAAVVGVLLGGTAARATVPIAPGTMEFQGGVAGIVLPEDIRGTYSAQPEIRVGYFLREALELQVQGDVRVWPLGDQAPDSYGIGASFLWFPPVHEERSLYFLIGAGGAYSDPPGPTDGGFDPLARGGFGFKVPMAGFGFLTGAFMTLEYRGEYVFSDDADFVSGAGLGISYFR